ncbi:hypothetical protein QBC40DRAFT_316509 [Triangularia verruculosa]|uniref:ABC-2 type transporter transmembrane domain-containing protein n=1 Tax=Triangularia verruculosa TaxID=2587418 RepID=A0AAN6X770_9PEZI|nr:hypothetical protein QBC40DRAFT_316509 [Triangularia verruculosa]
MSSLFIGFTFFQADGTGTWGNEKYCVCCLHGYPHFHNTVQQRSLYEVRERPSNAYSWKAFLIANIVVEIPYQILTGILSVVGADQASSRQGLILLFIFYASVLHTWHLITAMLDAHAAAGIVVLLTMMSTIFSGVLQTRITLPDFWVFMYYVSLFTY